MIKNVIFDLGKVLTNNDPSEYLRKYGYEEEKYKAKEYKHPCLIN